MTGARNQDVHDEATPTQLGQDGSPEAGPPQVADVRVRDLVHELVRIQDQLTAEARATGARPSPGSTRRRAALLRRERDVIRQLRAQRSLPERGDRTGNEQSPE